MDGRFGLGLRLVHREFSNFTFFFLEALAAEVFTFSSWGNYPWRLRMGILVQGVVASTFFDSSFHSFKDFAITDHSVAGR